MNQKLQYRASLSDTALPETLYTIHRFRVPGIIEARQGDVVKKVYIRDGYVIHASSTDLKDSLGFHLRRTGVLTTDQLADLTLVREGSEKRFGVLLMEQHILSPEGVYEAIRQQIEGIVWSLFYWDSGQVTYGPGELAQEDMVQIQLPLGQVIVHGIKRAPDARPLISRLGRRDTVFEPSFRDEDLLEIGLDADDYRLLSLVDGRRTLYDLCSEGPKPPAENAKLLYAFQVMHLIRRYRSEREGSGPVKIQLRTTGDHFPG